MSDKPLRKLLIILAVVLAVPIIPFVLFHQQIEQLLQPLLTSDVSAKSVFVLVVALLSTDIFLPIPSSVLSTLAGSKLGFLTATSASWLGMTIGASGGFAMARKWGVPWVQKLADSRDLAHMERVSQRYGVFLLILTRGLPIFAEATVLLMGLNQLSWKQFLWPVVLSNLGIAIAYSWLGQVAAENEFLPAALGVSVALPVLLSGLIRWKRTSHA